MKLYGEAGGENENFTRD